MGAMYRWIALSALALLLPVAGGCRDSADAEYKYTVAVMPMGQQHAYWKSVYEGARQAGDDLNVKVLFIGPDPPNDQVTQGQLLADHIADAVRSTIYRFFQGKDTD